MINQVGREIPDELLARYGKKMCIRDRHQLVPVPADQDILRHKQGHAQAAAALGNPQIVRTA